MGLRRRVVPGVLLVWLMATIPSDGHLGAQRLERTISEAVGTQGLRLVSWEAQAIAQKAADAIARPGSSLTSEEQKQLVLDYFGAVGEIGRLGDQIDALYSAGDDSGADAAPLQTRVDALRREQDKRRPAVERILEQQVGAVLEESGLVRPGLVWPPVRFQFTESPLYLILSPRDRIRVEKGVYLDPALTVEAMQTLENTLAASLDRSALVDGTGGFSSYPTMVLAYPEPEWVIDTVAHEWAHTNLVFRPLGMNYYGTGGMRTINETVASIVGEEISRRVIQRFYAERAVPAPWPRPLSMDEQWTATGERVANFEYGPFMRATRLEVDRLLSEGKVVEAESYMEAQRQRLVAEGIRIRKLNQAFFAFHGSYAVGPAATDPIGGKLRALRSRSTDLADFYRRVAGFSEPADLDAALSAPYPGAPGSDPPPSSLPP